MPRLDGWSLNERIDTLVERLERIENLLAALARKTYGLEDLVVEKLSEQINKKEKSNARKRNVQKNNGSKRKS